MCVAVVFSEQFTHSDIADEPSVWTPYVQCIWLIRLFTQHDTLLHTLAHLCVDKDTRVCCPLAHPLAQGDSVCISHAAFLHAHSKRPIKIKAILMPFLSSTTPPASPFTCAPKSFHVARSANQVPSFFLYSGFVMWMCVHLCACCLINYGCLIVENWMRFIRFIYTRNWEKTNNHTQAKWERARAREASKKVWTKIKHCWFLWFESHGIDDTIFAFVTYEMCEIEFSRHTVCAVLCVHELYPSIHSILFGSVYLCASIIISNIHTHNTYRLLVVCRVFCVAVRLNCLPD